ncbi:hypothetical protein BDN71DRAFT_1510095 [Pleurotus eryngii]|uniref:F-box domain-containing protein n=1 Tax=Pleurotus eryngii TaxID=5323 RepID=A0A9P5ZPA3_PLEER|nr:hypothetical protein BDN71DRAFT_1510095 [Pleurotus eryngii]
MKELPVEILDFILKYLFPDTKAIKSCSLVCREWSQLVQRHLFNSLVVGEDEDHDVDRCRRLLELVNESQNLARHFHHVRLLVSFDSPDWLELGRDILPELLSRLPEVRSLKLRSGSVQSAYSQLPDGFRLSLRHMLSSPSFEKLDLWGWVFVSSAKNLVELLQCCQDSLASLGLSLISYDDKSDNSEPPYVKLHKLKEIRFLGAGSFPYYRIFETPNVNTVFWPLHRSNEGHCRSTLVLQGFPDLVPHWKFHMHDGCEGVDIRMCKALQASSFAYIHHLCLAIDCYTSSNFAVHAIAYLRQLLPVAQLDSITIECLVNCDGPHGPDSWDHQHWGLLCDSLIPVFQACAAEYITLIFQVERCEEAGDSIGPHDPSDLENPSPRQPGDTNPQPVEAPVGPEEESDDNWDEDSLQYIYNENVETDTQSVKKQIAETRRMMRSRFDAAGLGEVVQMHTRFLLHDVEW